MKEYHKSALAETAVILLFTVMPTLFILIKMLLVTDNINNSALYKSGEFYLYSVSLLGSSFLIFNNFKMKKSDLLSLLGLLCLILLVVYSLAYTIIANTTNPRLNFVKWSSFFSIIISAIIFYYSQVITNKRSPDIGEQRRDEQEIIENALN